MKMKSSPPRSKLNSARDASASNIAMLNALNRKLKRNYMNSTSPDSHDLDKPHTDGRTSEFTEKFVPWPSQHHEAIHAAPQFSPIPVSADALDTTTWRSQAKFEQEMFEHAKELHSENVHSAGIRYGRSTNAPTFFAWNPETGRIPGYEGEDPTSPPGSVLKEHSDQNIDVTEYDQKYKWPPLEEGNEVKPSHDTLSLFSNTNNRECSPVAWETEQHERFASGASRGDPAVAGVHSVIAPRNPVNFAWPQSSSSKSESPRACGGSGPRDTEYSKSFPNPGHVETTKIAKTADSLSLFSNNGSLGNQRSWQSEQRERYSPIQFDVHNLTGEVAGVHSLVSSKPPVFFAWDPSPTNDAHDGQCESIDAASSDAVIFPNQHDKQSINLPAPQLTKSVDLDQHLRRSRTPAQKPVPFSIDLVLPVEWKTEYERSYCSGTSNVAISNNNNNNNSNNSNSSNTVELPRPPPPVPGVDFDCGASDLCDSLTNNTITQHMLPPPPPLPTTIVVAPNNNANAVPKTVDATRNEYFIPIQKDGPKTGSTGPALTKLAKSSQTVNSTEESNFMDSLDNSNNKPLGKVSAKAHTQKTHQQKDIIVHSEAPQLTKSAERKKHGTKMVTRSCYSLNAKSPGKTRSAPIAGFGCTNPRNEVEDADNDEVQDDHHDEQKYVVVPTPSIPTNDVEYSLPANHVPSLSTLVTDHQKWQTQQKKAYTRYRSDVLQDNMDSILRDDRTMSDSHAGSKSQYVSESLANFDWPEVDVGMNEAVKNEVKLHQRHHDILLSGNGDIRGSKIDSHARKLNNSEFNAQYCRQSIRKSQALPENHVFGLTTKKHAPLWVAGASRPKEMEGVFRSQAPQNNITVPPAAESHHHVMHASKPICPSSSIVKKDAAVVGWVPANNDGDSNAAAPGTVGSNTLGTSTKVDTDAASSITSVAPPTATSSMAVVRPGSADTNTFKSAASGLSVGSDISSTVRAPTRVVVKPAPPAKRSGIHDSKTKEDTASHPPGCSCTKCFSKPIISSTYQGPTPPTVSSPGKRVNLELMDSAIASRTAHIQGLRNYCEQAARKRCQSAPTRRMRGFGDVAHNSGVVWYKPAFKADIAATANPILSHQRYPSDSDKQIGRWVSETRNSFAWRGKQTNNNTACSQL